MSYFSLNIQYDWLINILILCYEEPGVVTIELIHGRALYVWINKMVSLYIITTPITGIEKNHHRLWVGCRNEIFTRLHSLCTMYLYIELATFTSNCLICIIISAYIQMSKSSSDNFFYFFRFVRYKRGR